MKAYINISQDGANHAEYGWVYFHTPELKDESLAIELIEYNTFNMGGNYTRPFFKKDVILMDEQLFNEWEQANTVEGDGEKAGEIIYDIIEAHKVLKTLK